MVSGYIDDKEPSIPNPRLLMFRPNTDPVTSSKTYSRPSCPNSGGSDQFSLEHRGWKERFSYVGDSGK